MTGQNTRWRNAVFGTHAPASSILVRLIVGLVVFLPEGIQKLEFPQILGAGRFANIGIPYPDLMGPFVGVVETICGALIIVGLFTQTRGDPADRHHGGRNRIDKSADSARARIFDLSPTETGALRILEHGARSPNRLLHATGINLSSD